MIKLFIRTVSDIRRWGSLRINARLLPPPHVDDGTTSLAVVASAFSLSNK